MYDIHIGGKESKSWLTKEKHMENATILEKVFLSSLHDAAGMSGGGGGTTKKFNPFPNVVFSESGGQLLPVLFEVLAGESTLVDDLHLLHYGTLPRLAGACAVENKLSINQLLCLRLRITE